jgi:hypothetical protein
LLFTYDEDFLTISAAWQRSSKHFPGILFAAQTGMSIGSAVADIQLIAEAQVITGLEVDELTAVHVLDAATWQQCRQHMLEIHASHQVRPQLSSTSS